MSKRTLLIIGAGLLAAGAFFWVGRRSGHQHPLAAQDAKKDIYQCSMHPQIVSDKPGTCPICGMQLTKVDQAAPEAVESEPSALPGHAAFTLTPERQQVIGVKTTVVEKKELKIEIRSVGRVAYDPELFNAIAEYKEAAAAKDGLPEAASPETRQQVDALVQASLLRLRLMGVSDQQLPDLLSADSSSLLLPGKSGWIYAQVFEHEADLVRPGLTAVISLPNSREAPFTGRVQAVDPVLDPATRTLRARIKANTSGRNLRPESFLQVKILVPLGKVLAIPENALLDTGEHQFVFVKKAAGEFEPRIVKAGREAEDHYEILEGLAEGEEIVTSANFLIDSESRFKAALESFSGQAGHAH